MFNRKTETGKFNSVIILLLMSLFVISTLLLEEKAFGNAKKDTEEQSGFELTVKDDLISLSAKDASLKEIMKEMGRKMVVDVVGNIPEEEKVSVEFNGLSLTDALEKLSSNYGYQMDSEKGENIAKIIVLPKRKETATVGITAKESEIQERESKESNRPEPFKFEFDPSEFMEKGE
ncbi:MAG: hypothetical protein MRK02_07130 [Candidatus Scalindua sp.]|nr:hypothetical protein [Candidatus Scalindua sp.]